MNNEISLSKLWRVFVNSWKKILIVVLAAMLIMGLLTHFVINKKYSSSVSFYVINVAPDSDYVTTSLMQVVEHLANDYIQIIKSDRLLVPVSEQLKEEHGIDRTPEQIRAAISTSVTPDSSTFSLKISGTDKDEVFAIAQTISENAPKIVREFTSLGNIIVEDSEGNMQIAQEEVEKIRVLNQPKLAKTHDSPSMMINISLAALAAAVVSYAVCFAMSFLKAVVTTEEDFAEISKKYPILGSIPRWD